MAEQIISASGVQYGAVVNAEGALLTQVIGSIVIGSVSAEVESVYVQSGTFFMVSGNAWTGIGSALITNAADVGSLAVQTTIGSVIQATDPWIVLGSVYSTGRDWTLASGTDSVDVDVSVTTGSESYNWVNSGGTWVNEPFVRVVEGSGTFKVIGSTEITNTVLPVSGTSFQQIIGSVYQLTDPWIVLGSVYSTGRDWSLSSGTDSIDVDLTVADIFVVSGNAWTGIGSTLITNAAEIGSLAVQTVIGSMFQSTDPWIVLGSAEITNTVLPISGEVTTKLGSTYTTSQIIRKVCGSPAVWYEFSSKANSIMIDNLGGDPIFFNFDALATAGSTSGYMLGLSLRTFDLITGSISILGSGTTTSPVQCIKLG
jgi:hypothetical protein